MDPNQDLGFAEKVEQFAEKIERFVKAFLRGTFAVGSALCSPFVLVFGWLVQLGESVVGVLARAWRFVKPGLAAFLVWIGRLDPFWLRQYGNSLLSESVELHLGTYTMLLGFSFAFELFAWGNMWEYSGIEGLTLLLMPMIFAGMVILLDRSILTMDDTSGGRRRLVAILGRVSFLFGIAFITAIPVELRVFSPEIDRVTADAEKVQVDAIRARAIAYETGFAETQKATSATIVTAQPKDIVDRRQVERAALVAQQTAGSREISGRLSATEKLVAAEVASGSKYGKARTRGGSGVTAAELRRQETQTRADLDAFTKASRAELAAFDAETERMRSEAAKNAVDEIATRDLALANKLQEVEAMPADELAAKYGGEYEQPNGFLARYRTLLVLVESDGKNEMIVWGCRLVMIVFGLSILLVKFNMSSEEVSAYFSLRAQAVSGNAGAVRSIIALATSRHDQTAIDILRMIARSNADARQTLETLGYAGNVEMAGWAPEVRALHVRHQAAQHELHAALVEFRAGFRGICERRDGESIALERHRLETEAEHLWNREVSPKIRTLQQLEGEFTRKGVEIPPWSSGFEEHDPRADARRLWKLPDDELVEKFGWSNPVDAIFRRPNVASA